MKQELAWTFLVLEILAISGLLAYAILTGPALARGVAGALLVVGIVIMNIWSLVTVKSGK